MKLVVVSVASLVGSLLVSASAWGVTFASPFVNATPASYAQCNVTNVGALPVTLTVDLREYFGSSVIPTFSDCTLGLLAPRATCSVTGPADTDVYCAITSSNSRIRAVMGVFDSATDEVRAMVPATK